MLHRQGVLDATLCYTVCQWLTAGQWFSSGTRVSSTNKTDHHDIAEILLKVAFNTINLNLQHAEYKLPFDRYGDDILFVLDQHDELYFNSVLWLKQQSTDSYTYRSTRTGYPDFESLFLLSYLLEYSGIQHILCCVLCFVVLILCLVCLMLSLFLDCPFLMSLRFSLSFICNDVCVVVCLTSQGIETTTYRTCGEPANHYITVMDLSVVNN